MNTWVYIHPRTTGGDSAEVPRGRPEEERDHHPLPGDAQWHPGPDRGAQHPQHQAVPGEQRSGGETQGAHFTVRPARGGNESCHVLFKRQSHRIRGGGGTSSRLWICTPHLHNSFWHCLKWTYVKAHTSGLSGPLSNTWVICLSVATAFQLYVAKGPWARNVAAFGVKNAS